VPSKRPSSTRPLPHKRRKPIEAGVAVLYLRVPEKLAQSLRKLAAADRRPLSHWVELRLEELVSRAQQAASAE
jgi:hypothetical protein